jgi:hypothetical protein
MNFDKERVDVKDFILKINIIINKNKSDVKFLKKISDSKILYGQYFSNESEFTQQLKVFFQVLTLNFYSPSDC